MISSKARYGTARLNFDPGCNSQSPVEADPWQRVEYFTHRVAEDPPNIDGAKREGPAFLLDVAKFLTQEDKVSVLLSERNQHVSQHLINSFLHLVQLRGRGDGRVQQAGDILYTNWQIPKDLENRDRFRDILMQVTIWEADENFADSLMYRGESSSNVLLKFVVKCDGRREPANRLICHGGCSAFTLQNILNDLDGRS